MEAEDGLTTVGDTPMTVVDGHMTGETLTVVEEATLGAETITAETTIEGRGVTLIAPIGRRVQAE